MNVITNNIGCIYIYTNSINYIDCIFIYKLYKMYKCCFNMYVTKNIGNSNKYLRDMIYTG